MLEQEIKSDIQERKELMSKIKTFSSRYPFDSEDKELFLRYSIPTVYAIWEGFIQTSFQTYVDELNTLNLTTMTLCKPILVYHLETNFKQFKEYPGKPTGKIVFFDKLSQFYQSESIEITREINTESNVGFNVLNKILAIFNLQGIQEYPEPRYSIKQDLDGFLLRKRNAIAHGELSTAVSQEDIERAIYLIETLMDLVFDRIIEGFETQSYLHQS